MSESEHVYELKKPFKYGRKGDLEEAVFVTLFEPNYKLMKYFIPIKQGFTRAVEQMQAAASEQQKDLQVDGSVVESSDENNEIADDISITPAEVIRALYVSNVDVDKIFLNAGMLFREGGALVDGDTKMTAPLLDKTSVSDFEGLVGAYIANFIVDALLSGD